MNETTLQLKRAGKAALAPFVNARDRFRLSDRLANDSRWPVASAVQAAGTSPFFVLGSPRSGTTLLRAILCAHPDVVIPPENGRLHRMILTFGRSRSLPWERVVERVLEAFRGGYEFDHWGIDLECVSRSASALAPSDRSLARLIGLLYEAYRATHCPDKTIWGDKSTPGDFRYLSLLGRVFPRARYVHIVRDGRDCVASSIRAGFFNRSHRQAAYAWSDNVRTCRDFGRRLGDENRFLTLHYEDLVQTPEPEIRRLCSFLGLPPSDSMLEHQNQVARSTPDVYDIRHHENVRGPITAGSSGRWRSELDPPALALVTRVAGAELRAFGYS